MANYNLVVGSKFTPFTYDELVKPLQQQTDLHNQYEDAYGALDAEASAWEAKINPEIDKKAAEQYQKYANDLRARANELAIKGLSADSRRQVMNMKSRYNTEIIPIKDAVERRQALTDEQRKLQAADDSLRFSVNYATESLDNLLNNPQASYEALSGKVITARTAAAVANYAKTIINDPTYKHVMGSFYWQIRQQAGYTPEQILAEAMGDADAPAELKKIRENIHATISGNGAYDRAWADAYISEGMHAGIGTAGFQYQQDPNQMTEYQKQSLALHENNGGSGSGSTPRVAVERPTIITGNGERTQLAISNSDNTTYKGKDLKVQKTSDGKVLIYTHSGADGLPQNILAEYNTLDGTYKVHIQDLAENNNSREELMKYFGGKSSNHRVKKVGTNAGNYDVQHMEHLMSEIQNIYENYDDVSNYRFIYNPDFAQIGSENGSITIVPKKREQPTANSSIYGGVSSPAAIPSEDIPQ